jgi:nicotinamide-nucleotide amidase
MPLNERVAQLLIENKKTLALAESCTGGLLAAALTDIPGSSRFFRVGTVVYANEAKSGILKIPPAALKRHGAVSEKTAEAMARAIRQKAGTDFGVGITGIAGPGGGSRTKPVGLTYIAVNTPLESLCLKCLFKGSRARVRSQAVRTALQLLLEFLSPDG